MRRILKSLLVNLREVEAISIDNAELHFKLKSKERAVAYIKDKDERLDAVRDLHAALDSGATWLELVLEYEEIEECGACGAEGPCDNDCPTFD